MDDLPDIKIFAINRKPTYEDLKGYCTHSSNKEFISEIVFKYQLSSDYPQYGLRGLNLYYSAKIVEIDGTCIHLIMMSSKNNQHYGLYTFPDEDKNIRWFERILSFLLDLSDGRIKGKTIRSQQEFVEGQITNNHYNTGNKFNSLFLQLIIIS